METVPVTLIVKAPNQQIEDQTIKCELSWTINKLKQHLSEVYPSKPAQHEQKLIYSGQLLSDAVILRDVLRQYEGQETHTMHLVCSAKYNLPTHQPIPSPTTQNMPQASTSTTQSNVSNSDNIEQRIPNVQWPPMDPNQYMLQMAWMQHAYMQYMTQYMNLNSMPNGNFNPVERGEQVPEVQPPAPQRPREPENAERDWLDLFYMLSRVLILFSVVYFYSSPLRFVGVVLLGFAFYLYQIGFFRNQINNNNNHNNNNVVAEGEQIQPEDSPSMLTLVWTFFSTFFASLIPEVPQAV